MKKIIFLLLLSAACYGQADFPEGINLGGNTATAETAKLVSQQPITGQLNYVNATALPISTAAQDSLNKKLNLPTGFLQGLQLSINADPTKFNIAGGYYVVTDFTNLAAPYVKIITYAGATGLTPAYLASANSTYIALDINGGVISSASPFTNTDRRTLAIVGNVVHSNNTTINVTNEIKAPIVAGTNQLHDFMRAVGFLNEEGNIYAPSGANLQINKSAGKIFGMGINSIDYLNPHQLTIASQTALTFAYRLRGGTQYANTTSIDPNNYDNAGALTSVPVGNRWTIQRINLFQSGLTRVQYGQAVYNSYNDAVTALPTQSFVTEQNIADNAVFRCYLIVQQGTTNLTSAVAGGTALFVPVDKFGNVIGNGSVALTYANIVAALGFTPENAANKTGTLTASSTLYPNNDAVISGLLGKQNTLTAGTNITIDNTIPTAPVISATGGGGGTIDAVPTDGSTNAVQSNGVYDFVTLQQVTAGTNKNLVNGKLLLGTGAGEGATGNNNSIFLGEYAGYNATGSQFSVFIGREAGNDANNSEYSNFLGYNSGVLADNCLHSNFFGNAAGGYSTGSGYGNFFGQYTGFNIQNSPYCNLFGFQVGKSFTGNKIGANNIIIGTNISLPNAAANRINLGGVIFGFNSNSDTSGDPKIIASANARVAIGSATDDGINALQVAGSTTTSALTLTTTPTTSAGGYDVLTRNSTTGVIEKTTISAGGSLLTTTDQSWTGRKSSTNTGTTSVNGLNLTNNGTSGSTSVNITNTSTGTGMSVTDTTGGVAISVVSNGIGNGLSAINNSTGKGMSAVNNSTGSAAYFDNESTGVGISAQNVSTGYGMLMSNLSSGPAVQVNGTVASTGKLFIGSNNFTDTFTLAKDGAVVSGSTITATGFFQSSDIRLKKIQQKSYGDVSKIRAIQYLWKDKSKGLKPQVGYSAQQVQRYIPNAVEKNESGELSVNYIQVLIAKIESLENRIKELEK